MWTWGEKCLLKVNKMQLVHLYSHNLGPTFYNIPVCPLPSWLCCSNKKVIWHICIIIPLCLLSRFLPWKSNRLIYGKRAGPRLREPSTRHLRTGVQKRFSYKSTHKLDYDNYDVGGITTKRDKDSNFEGRYTGNKVDTVIASIFRTFHIN